MIMGDSECGKTNLLKVIAQGLIERYGDDELVFGVFDPRRGLRGAIPEEYRGGYAYNSKLAAGLAHAALRANWRSGCRTRAPTPRTWNRAASPARGS